MSDEITAALQRLEAGQEALRDHLDKRIDGLLVEVLGAVRESNESILGALGALHSSTQDCRERVRELELKAS